MAKLVIDFSDYRALPERRITAGRHLVKIVNIETVKTKNGDPMINVTYEILDGDDKGKEFMDRLVIMDKTLFRIYGFLFALTGKKVDKKKLAVDPDKWIGKKMYITVSDQENTYQGRTTLQSNVDSYSRFAGAVVDEPEALDAEVHEDVEAPAAPADELDDIDLDDIDI